MSTIMYLYSTKLVEECDKLPAFPARASMVQDLINSYKLLGSNKITAVQSVDATEEELKSFHSSSYVDFMKKVNGSLDLECFEEEGEEFGLGYDCPIVENFFDVIRTIAGASISAAKLLALDKCNIAINWFGGWHHAQRDGAEGFCYVNDIVLAIQTLSKAFRKILYIDLDIHHGDGVENAFSCSRKILTLSFHKVGPGFFPGTGRLDEKNGKYMLNVPLLDGIGDKTYLNVFSNVFPLVVEKFKPEVLVVQCGADGLNGDRIGECNLTLNCYGECIRQILDCHLLSLFLGGGGYNFPNTARLWTYLTSVIIGEEIENDIPDISECFTQYGPSYELHIDQGLQKDSNSESYVEFLLNKIKQHCDEID